MIQANAGDEESSDEEEIAEGQVVENVNVVGETNNKNSTKLKRTKTMDEEEKSEVINEANKIYDVENVIPSIYLVSELSRNKI